MWLILALTILGAGAGVKNSSIIPDSSGFSEISRWPFGPGFSLALDTTRNLIFLGSGAGVLILQPDNGDFSLVSDGIRTKGGNIRTLLYDHQLLFTGGDGAELEIWNVSSPTNPSLVFRYQDTVPSDYGSARVEDLSIYQNYLIVAFNDGYDANLNYHSYVKFFDLSTLQIVASISRSSEIGGIYVENNRLFVQDGLTLYVYDISTVTDPTQITNFSDLSKKFVIKDTLLYGVNDGMWGSTLYIYDISDLSNPVQINSATSTLTEVYRVRMIGNSLFLCGTFLEAWDVSDPAHLDGRSWGFGLPGGSGIHDITLSNGSFMSASGIGGLSVIEFDTLGNPYEANSYRTPGRVSGIIRSSGHTYYLSSTNNGSTTLSVLDSGGYIGKARMYVSGLKTHPEVLNDRLYFITDTALAYFDVTDPHNPHSGGVLYLPPSYNRTFLLNDNYAYVTSDSGIYVIELSTMRQVGTVQDTGLTGGVALATSGNYLYLAARNRIDVFDISNPGSPALLSINRISEAYANFRSMAIRGNYIYVSTEVNQIVILSLSDPVHPSFTGSYFPPDNRGYGLYDLQIRGDYLFGTEGSGFSTIVAFDISSPISPVIAGYYDNYYTIGGQNVFFSVEGNNVYLGDYSIGVHVLNFNPTGISESPVFANIYPGYTSINTIKFSLPYTELVNIKVFDVSGRVFLNNKAVHRAGKHTIELGNLKNGVYFYIIKTKDFALRGKLLVIR